MCDWLYVEDYCKAIDLILHNGKVGEVYNIGGHSEMRYAIGLTKIHNELGWLSETKFADGIKKTIQRYLDNCEWWENIISGEY